MLGPDEGDARTVAATEALHRGDLRPMAVLAGAAEPWRSVLAVHRALAGGSNDGGAQQGGAGGATPADVPAAVVETMGRARLALLGFDRAGLARTSEVLRALLGASDPRAVWVSVAHALVAGDDTDLARALEVLPDALREATKRRIAPLVVDLEAIRALAVLGSGDLGQAVMLARRASRMARNEAMPQQEYLAHLVLARVRRWSQHAHLATRILSSLARIAPTPYHRMIEWELRMSGARFFPDGSEDPYVRVGVRASALDALVDAAVRGDRGSFEDAGERLRASAGDVAFVAREAAALPALIDPEPRAHGSPDADAFRSCTVDDVPFGLGAVASASIRPDDPLDELAWIVLDSAGPRRFLRPGLGLLGPRETVLPGKRHRGRKDIALAALAAAGRSGVDERRYFESVYGFPYDHTVHEGPYRVLLHRLRRELPPNAEALRENGVIRLEIGAPICVPDPRPSAPAGDRALRLVAANPGATARAIAELAGVPLRTVQEELQQLVNDGACVATRDGRSVGYFVEDTTFSEPTSHDLE